MVWKNFERSWGDMSDDIKLNDGIKPNDGIKTSDDILVVMLKEISKATVNQDLPLPPIGRFKAMAREAVLRRSASLLQESLIFLGSAVVLLVVEFLLLDYSGFLFLVLQSLAIITGVIWLAISIHAEKGRTKVAE
jgi:hypothetical protein